MTEDTTEKTKKKVSASDFFNKDVVSIRDFSKEQIDFVLELAKEIEERPRLYSEAMKRKIMVPLFFEPSSRTCTSFQMAMMRMGGSVLDFDVEQSSIKKGETLKDTAVMFRGYKPDVVVIRHPLEGSAKLFADIVGFPVINAGDGKNQHPTQTILDLYTIKEILGDINGAKIGIVGDLKYGRTTHSLSFALSRYSGVNMIYVSPDELRMPSSICTESRNNGARIIEKPLKDLERVISDVDILYMTRIQRERFPKGDEGERQYAQICSEYRLTIKMLERAGNKNVKIMHPKPKIDEIEAEIDDSEYAYYPKQEANGVYNREAILFLILGGQKI